MQEVSISTQKGGRAPRPLVCPTYSQPGINQTNKNQSLSKTTARKKEIEKTCKQNYVKKIENTSIKYSTSS